MSAPFPGWRVMAIWLATVIALFGTAVIAYHWWPAALLIAAFFVVALVLAFAHTFTVRR